MRRCVKAELAVVVLLVATFAHASDSQFLFDDNGNLLVQSANLNVPPQITGHPQNRVVGPGETATFSVVATGGLPLTFQWRFNGTDIGGATGDALFLQNVSTNNEGQYTVVVTNPSGSVTSTPALLAIDSDHDGMGDSWELLYFGNLDQNASRDFDNDDSSNIEEFRNGTDPTDRNSYAFYLTVISDAGTVIKTPDQRAYTNGQTVTLTAIPPPNGVFHAWLGSIVTRSNPVTLVMTNDKTIYARFTPIVFTWTSPANGDWDTDANWSPRLAPRSNDTAIISRSVTVTLNTPADCANVTLGSGSSSPTLTGSGTLRVRGKFAWISGSMSGSGRTVIETGANLEFNPPIGTTPSLSGRTLENAGTALWNGDGNLGMNSGAVLTNRAGALLEVQSGASFAVFVGSSRFDNAGTFRKSATNGTLTVPVGVSFNNSGAVEVQTGALRLGGGGSSSGIIAATNATVVEWTAGTFLLNPGAQLDGDGLYKISGTAIVTDNATNTVGNLDLITGTLDGTGTLTVTNTMTWTSGTMGGSGRTIIPAGVTLNLATPTGVSLNTRTLENGGTTLWTGAGIIGISFGGIITNRTGALFHVQNAAGINIGGGGGSRFDNAGTFRKSANAGTTTVASGVSFNNSGAVEIQTGTLNLGGGGTHSGSFDLPEGTALILSGGTHTANGSSSITGAGQFTVSGAVATLAGLVNVRGSNTFSGGAATFTGNYICTNNTLTISSVPSATFNFSGTGLVSPAVLNFINGTLTGTSTVTVNNVMNWTGGAMNGSGRTIIPVGATLNAAIPSSAGMTSRTLENGGTALWTGAGNIGLFGGAVITNRAGALFHAQNAASLGFFNGDRFDNAGTFRKSANNGTLTIGSVGTFNNFGTVEIEAGTVLCTGGFNNSGAVSLSAGTTNRLAGGGSVSGSFSAPVAALVEWTGGGFTLNPGAQLNDAGLYKINGGNVTANANLAVENLDLVHGSSTLDGTGAVTIATAMNWTMGVMRGSGRTTISAGATLQVGSANGVTLNRTLENGGTAIWTGAGNCIVLNGVITNRAGALFHAQNAATFFPIGGARFDNAGTFRKSASTGPTTVQSGMNFNNSGTVDIRSGILAANGPYISSSNARLNCALGGTTAGTNYGQLQVAGAVTLNGGLSVDLLPGFTPATNDVFTVVTAGSRNSTFASFSYPSNRVTLSVSNSPTSVILRATEVFPVPQPVLLTPQLVGQNALLTWTATSNVTYRLENNALGSTNWVAVPGDITTLSNRATKLDTLTPSNRFYRVRALP